VILLVTATARRPFTFALSVITRADESSVFCPSKSRFFGGSPQKMVERH
jgi:hypothetical protein